MNICLIDDNELLLQMLELIMKNKKYNINTFNNVDSFIKSDIIKKTDILFIDLILSDRKSKILIKTLNNSNLQMEIVIISVESKEFVERQLKDIKYRYFIRKPFIYNDFLKCINEIYLERQLISDFIKNDKPKKNILIAYNKEIPYLDNIKKIPINKLLKSNGEYREFSDITIMITDLENISNDSISSILFKNLVNLNNKSNKFIIKYCGTITDMETQFRKIPNIYSYLIENAYILSENMS